MATLTNRRREPAAPVPLDPLTRIVGLTARKAHRLEELATIVGPVNADLFQAISLALADRANQRAQDERRRGLFARSLRHDCEARRWESALVQHFLTLHMEWRSSPYATHRRVLLTVDRVRESVLALLEAWPRCDCSPPRFPVANEWRHSVNVTEWQRTKEVEHHQIQTMARDWRLDRPVFDLSSLDT